MSCLLCYMGPDSDKTENKVLCGASGNICPLFGVLGQACCDCVRKRRRGLEGKQTSENRTSNKQGMTQKSFD